MVLIVNLGLLKLFIFVNKKYSEGTLEQYALAIDMLLADIGKRLPDIKTNDIRYHLAMYQTTRNVEKATVDNRRRNLSSFFSWLAKEEIIIKSPMIRIAKIKSEVEVKLPFSDDDIEKMRCATMVTRNSKRDRALIEFMLTTGCRVSEIVNLDISHVNFLREEAIVKGKGNKERKVYISRTAMHYLQEYISDREINADSPLFANKSGKRWSKQSIEKLIKSIAKKVEVDNAHPHRFRRTFATNALNKGMPVQCLQKILGHQSLDVTMRYCTVDDDTARIEHRRVA
jgi:site-specific recombinase XerD